MNVMGVDPVSWIYMVTETHCRHMSPNFNGVCSAAP